MILQKNRVTSFSLQHQSLIGPKSHSKGTFVMIFLGYHGTSETSAQNILTVGIQRRFLPETGQIGPGFYLARMNGELPQWGAEWATQGARDRLYFFQRIVSYLTGEQDNPLISNDAKRTILKIYATQPLLRCKWSIMNPPSLHFIRALINERHEGTAADASAKLVTDWSKWLQMVVAPEELQYLVARRDDGVPEVPRNWESKEGPIEYSSARQNNVVADVPQRPQESPL